MTLPIERILPTPPRFDAIPEAGKYLQTLIFELQNMYEELTQNINGSIRNDAQVPQFNWKPTISSTGVQGTIDYDNQTGWSLRQGILTQIWFDVEWTAISGSSGNLYLELPYKVAKSLNMPFVGVLQYSDITLGGAFTNLVINGIPNTYRGEIWRTGTGLTTDNLSIPSSGRIIGNLYYIGAEDE